MHLTKDGMMLGFAKGQKITITATVEDPEEAEKIAAWMYADQAKIKVETYGLKLETVGWGNNEEKLKELLRPLAEALQKGEINL